MDTPNSDRYYETQKEREAIKKFLKWTENSSGFRMAWKDKDGHLHAIDHDRTLGALLLEYYNINPNWLHYEMNQQGTPEDPLRNLMDPNGK